MTPECSLGQELGPSHKPGATAGLKERGVRREERVGKAGPCPQVAVQGWEVRVGSEGGTVCVVSPGGDSQGVTVWYWKRLLFWEEGAAYRYIGASPCRGADGTCCSVGAECMEEAALYSCALLFLG